MTLDEFTVTVIARIPATASWRFFEKPGLLVASCDPAWLTYNPETGRWSVALDAGAFRLRAETLDAALGMARAWWKSTLLAARDLELLPWTPHPQTAPEARETETT